jgi:peptidoglycan/LPS O-acetylase OafA/YrhL
VTAWLVLRPGALRLALAAAVVATHVGWLGDPSDGVAVSGFFMLSGYWVARLWDERYSRCVAPLTTFYVSRAWRIYPLAAIGTLSAYAIGGGSLPELARDILLLPRLGSDWPIDPPLWSLVVEVQFYAVAPFLFVVLRRPLWAGAVIAASLAAYAAYIVWPLGPFYLAVWLLLFAVGALYARAPQPVLAAKLAPWGLAATIAICTVGTITGLPDHPTTHALMLLASALFAPYVAASVGQKSNARDKQLGDFVYPLYVIHMPVAALVSALALPGGAYVRIVLAVAAALALLRAVDVPLERLRHRFVSRRYQRPTVNSGLLGAAWPGRHQ